MNQIFQIEQQHLGLQLLDLQVKVYNKDRTEELIEYKMTKQGISSISYEPGNSYQGKYVGYFTQVPNEEVTLQISYTRAANDLHTDADGNHAPLDERTFTKFTSPFRVKKEVMNLKYFIRYLKI